MGTLSFFPSKNLGGYGDGGMVVTQDERLYARLMRLRTHGSVKTYFHEEVGYNSRLDTLQAAVLHAKLPHLGGWSARRRAHAAYYSAALHNLRPHVELPVIDPQNESIFNQYTIRAERRDALQAHLKALGIGSAIYYPLPLHLQPCFAYLGYRAGQLPESERAASEVLALPVYPELTQAQQDEVIGAIREFYDNASHDDSYTFETDMMSPSRRVRAASSAIVSKIPPSLVSWGWVRRAATGRRVCTCRLSGHRLRCQSSGRRRFVGRKSHIQDVPSDQVRQFVESGRLCRDGGPGPPGGGRRGFHCRADAAGEDPRPRHELRRQGDRYNCGALPAGHVGRAREHYLPGDNSRARATEVRSARTYSGRDIFLAFSPERVDPGNEQATIRETPLKSWAASPRLSFCRRGALWDVHREVVPVSSPEAAELVKLLENTFRSVNIGLVNEMAIICDRLGVNVWEVIEAAATKPFGFMRFTPGPGIGGHCIPLDPHYLAWKMRTLNYRTRFIDVASEINSQMPDFVVEKVAHALNDVCKSVKGSRMLVVGVAYKKNIDDIRESPALDVIRLFEEPWGGGCVPRSVHPVVYRGWA